MSWPLTQYQFIHPHAIPFCGRRPLRESARFSGSTARSMPALPSAPIPFSVSAQGYPRVWEILLGGSAIAVDVGDNDACFVEFVHSQEGSSPSLAGGGPAGRNIFYWKHALIPQLPTNCSPSTEASEVPQRLRAMGTRRTRTRINSARTLAAGSFCANAI
jgi:hypothetical protein